MLSRCNTRTKNESKAMRATAAITPYEVELARNEVVIEYMNARNAKRLSRKATT